MSKQTRQLNHAYLYADGHAVLVYEKQDPDAGPIHFCEIYQKWTPAVCHFQGRLTFSRHEARGFLRLARQAKEIRATVPSRDQGSQNSQKLELAVGRLEFDFGKHWTAGDCVNFISIPGLAATGFCYQPEQAEAFELAEGFWGHLRIARTFKVDPAAAQ